MTNNGRDITNILDLNTVLNSTISCIIAMCGNREKTCLPFVMLSHLAS